MQLGQPRRWLSNRRRSDAGQRPFEVVGDQLDHLLAHQVVTASQQDHHRPLVGSSDSSADRSRLRPRWSSTRWLPSVMPEHVADVLAGQSLDVPEDHDLPLAGGSSPRASPRVLDQVAATRRSSASDSQALTGSAQAPAAVEPGGVDRRLRIGERQVRGSADAGRCGPG